MQDIKIPALDKIVIKALKFFTKERPPKLDLNAFSMPFVVGSGNAYNTGAILFSDRGGVFADESNFRQVVAAYGQSIKQNLIRQAVIVSASGEKDSVWEVELAKQLGLSTTLLTCEKESSAAKLADTVISYRKIPEPYTYNTSTYLGMLLSATGEDAGSIKTLIESLAFPESFKRYKAYALILPDRYSNICPMLDIKKSELFGPHLSLRAFTQGQARHAKFVIPWEKELVITIGDKNELFGVPAARWDIPFPANASYGTMLALTYYIVGLIQSGKPAYFKKNIGSYCADFGPKAYGKDKPFDVIVPGN